MSFSSGTFSLVAGNPVVTGTTISSTTQNNTMSDVATGLSTCLLKDGTQTATAAIPFITGVTTTSTTFAVFNTTATTINAFGAASVALNIGHASGAATALGTWTFTSPATTTSITTGSTTFTAWAGATTLLTLGGTGATASVAIPGTLDSTSISTGSLRTAGGLGVTKALWVGGLANIAGAVTMQSSLSVTSTISGSNLSGTNTGDQSAASQAEMEAATSATVFGTPLRQHFHPGHPKAFIAFNGTGTPAVLASYNMDAVTPITDNGIGDYTLNIGTDFSTANYSVSGMTEGDPTSNTGRASALTWKEGGTRTAGAFQIVTVWGVRFDIASGGGPKDWTYVSVHFLGDQ